MDWSKKERESCEGEGWFHHRYYPSVRYSICGSIGPVAYCGAGAVAAGCSLDEVVDGSRGLHKGLCHLVHNCIRHPAVNFTQLLTQLLGSLVKGRSAARTSYTR